MLSDRKLGGDFCLCGSPALEGQHKAHGHSFLLGPKWLQVAVAVPHNSAQPCPGPWPAASVPVATGLGAGAVCQPWSGLNVHLSSLKRGQE